MALELAPTQFPSCISCSEQRDREGFVSDFKELKIIP